MSWITLEHSRIAYRFDFALYGAVSLAMAGALVFASPAGGGAMLLLWAVLGLAGWSLAEYLLHRFVLHGLPPFKGWHAQHHQRPTALMGSPTYMSASLFTLLVALPAWAFIGAWPAVSLTFGLITGYLAYGLTHHATHHQVPLLDHRSAWLMRRRRWHALHHARRAPGAPAPGHYGVSSGLWDELFGSTGRSSKRA